MTLTHHLPRRHLAFLPTPLHALPRLSQRLSELPARSGQPRIGLWIKRDDLTGLAGGGNKARKLEFLVAHALERSADTLITTGAAQSNHCRQTAAAAAQAGLACSLVLSGKAPAVANGNLLLDELLGADIEWTSREERLHRLHTLESALRDAGRRPYLITYGGSDPIGAAGYAAALEELKVQAEQLEAPIDAIVTASSSAGTQAGLAAGAWALGWDIPILGISIDAAAPELKAKVAALATDTAALLGHPHAFAPQDILVDDGYLGAGYGIPGDLERHAIRFMAATEGIVLDPVYTGRAFGGLLDLFSRPGRLEERLGRRCSTIVFWHTGGMPALFAYAGEMHHE